MEIVIPIKPIHFEQKRVQLLYCHFASQNVFETCWAWEKAFASSREWMQMHRPFKARHGEVQMLQKNFISLNMMSWLLCQDIVLLHAGYFTQYTSYIVYHNAASQEPRGEPRRKHLDISSHLWVFELLQHYMPDATMNVCTFRPCQYKQTLSCKSWVKFFYRLLSSRSTGGWSCCCCCSCHQVEEIVEALQKQATATNSKWSSMLIYAAESVKTAAACYIWC